MPIDPPFLSKSDQFQRKPLEEEPQPEWQTHQLVQTVKPDPLLLFKENPALTLLAGVMIGVFLMSHLRPMPVIMKQ